MLDGIPLDREKLREERKLRNKKKREDKKISKSKDIESKTDGKGVAIVSPEFFADFQSTSKAPERAKSKRNCEVTVNILELVRADVTIIEDSVVRNKDCNVPVGNHLDGSQPVRSKGKHREEPRTKRQSKFKRNLVLAPNEVNTEKLAYSTNVITDNLTTICESFVKEVVTLQEKLFKRDPRKGDIKRRYVVGFHETKKYLMVNKVKLLIIPTDIKLVNYNDPLHETVKELCKLAEGNGIPYVYALKRRKLGALTLKFIPVSCFTVLNYDGANECFKELVEEISRAKQSFKKQQCEGKIDQIPELLEKLKVALI